MNQARLIRERPVGLPLHLLVEHALGLGLCQGSPIGSGIRERVVPRRWPACRRNRWRQGRLADVGENALYRGRPR
jgi:hypothetical protein